MINFKLNLLLKVLFSVNILKKLLKCCNTQHKKGNYISVIPFENKIRLVNVVNKNLFYHVYSKAISHSKVPSELVLVIVVGKPPEDS